MSLVALWLRAALALGAVLLALAGLQYVIRFLARGMGRFRARGRLLDVVESVPLGQQTLLHVVRIADRYFALGVAPSSVALICELPAESIADCHAERSELSRAQRAKSKHERRLEVSSSTDDVQNESLDFAR